MIAEPGIYVRLNPDPPHESWQELELWRYLARRAGPAGIAVSIEFHPTGDGPQDVVAWAVVGGAGLRAPLGKPRDPFVLPTAEIVSLDPTDDGLPGPAMWKRMGGSRAVEAVRLALGDPAVVEILGERWGAVRTRRPGRRGRPDLHYAMTALDYVRALEASPRAPIKFMTNDAAARGEVRTRPMITSELREARRRGLLTDSEKGLAGGELTEKALAELRRVRLLEGDR